MRVLDACSSEALRPIAPVSRSAFWVLPFQSNKQAMGIERASRIFVSKKSTIFAAWVKLSVGCLLPRG